MISYLRIGVLIISAFITISPAVSFTGNGHSTMGGGSVGNGGGGGGIGGIGSK